MVHVAFSLLSKTFQKPGVFSSFSACCFHVASMVLSKTFQKPGVFSSFSKTIWPMVQRDQASWYEQWTEELQVAGDLHDHKKMFGMLQRLGRRKGLPSKGPRPLPRLRRQDGTPAETVEECQLIWRRQFAAIEGGIFASEQELAEAHVTADHFNADDFDMSMVPTMWELQNALSRCKGGKTPGPNGLLPEILKAGGSAYCTHLLAMTTKSMMGCREALTWKGGQLIPLYKGRGSPQDAQNHRAIFISNVSANLYHSAIRSRLEKAWTVGLEALQQGGRKGFGTDLSHHLIQSFLAWGRETNKTTAILFVDLQQAFYSVIRASLFSKAVSSDSLKQALQDFGILPQDFHEILDTTGQDFALAGLPSHCQHVVMDFFTSSYFKMASTPGVVATKRGTRPGDPLGDLLFNMVFKLVMADMKQQVMNQTDLCWLRAAGTLDEISAPAGNGFFQLAFVDDLACAFQIEDGKQLMPTLGLMTSALHDSARRRGLQLNYKTGKTEAMVHPTGAGARKIRHDIWHTRGVVLPVVVDQGVVHLRLTKAYRHLGTFLQEKSVTTKDRQLRTQGAKQAMGTLMRSFFTKRNVNMATKVKIMDALVTAKFAYNVHTWAWVTEREIALWENGLRDLVRKIVQPQLQGLPFFRFETADAYLHANRLRYFARMLRSAPTVL